MIGDRDEQQAGGTSPERGDWQTTHIAGDNTTDLSVIIHTGNISKCRHVEGSPNRTTRGELLTALKCTMNCWMKDHSGEPVLGSKIIGHPRLMESVTDREHKDIHAKLFVYKEIEPQHVKDSVQSTLEALGTDYIDAFSIHDHCVDASFTEAWKVLEHEQAAGRVKELGASDLSAQELQVLLEKVQVRPTQLELDLKTMCCKVPDDLKAICAANGVAIMSHDDGDGHIPREDVQDIMTRVIKGESVLTPIQSQSPSGSPPPTPTMVRRPPPVKWEPVWAVRYNVVDEGRSVIENIGYTLCLKFSF